MTPEVQKLETLIQKAVYYYESGIGNFPLEDTANGLIDLLSRTPELAEEEAQEGYQVVWFAGHSNVRKLNRHSGFWWYGAMAVDAKQYKVYKTREDAEAALAQHHATELMKLLEENDA